MCVIYFAFDRHHDHGLILAANRDEFYDRPTEKAQFWTDFPDIYAGRDMVGGGTWLGVTRSGRFAAVTNYRDPKAASGDLSRGNLVADFLKSEINGSDYLESVANAADRYSGFNLLIGEISGERKEAFYFSNRDHHILEILSGVYGLSNHLLDTPWPKIERGKQSFAKIIDENLIRKPELFDLLADETLADDEALPDTGIGYEREKLLSAIFIKTPVYGTRSSTVLTIDRNSGFDFEERVFV
ncbi:MAG: NRDE family protein [Blastocatellia bacterium]